MNRVSRTFPPARASVCVACAFTGYRHLRHAVPMAATRSIPVASPIPVLPEHIYGVSASSRTAGQSFIADSRYPDWPVSVLFRQYYATTTLNVHWQRRSWNKTPEHLSPAYYRYSPHFLLLPWIVAISFLLILCLLPA